MGRIIVPYFGSVSAVRTITWIVPGGVTLATFSGTGGGGGGGSAQSAGARGGGGAGGAFAQAIDVPVTPGESLTINVPTDANGSTVGGDAEVLRGATVLMRAKGGAAGGNAASGSLSGTAGNGSTTGCTGGTLFAGGNGSAGVASTRTGAGGGGASNGGVGGSASGITAGTGQPDWGGVGGSGSTSAGGAAGTQGLPYGGGGSGGRANDGTLRAGGKGTRGLVIVVYDSPFDSSIATSTATFLDCFTGGDDSDISGRALDGCGERGAAGSWIFDTGYDDPADHVYIKDGTVGFDVTVGADVQVLVDGASCDDEGPTNYQGARATVEWPNYDTVSTPSSCTLLWQDDFSGTFAGDTLNGRVHNGGSLGSLTWVRDDTTSPPAAVSEVLIDASGRAYQPAEPAPDAGQDHYEFYRLTGAGLAGLPAEYDVVIDVYRTPAIPHNGSVGAPVRMQAPAGADPTTKSYQFLYSTESASPYNDDQHGHWTARSGANGSQGTVITGSLVDPPGDHGIDEGETRSIRVKVRNKVDSHGVTYADMTTYIYDADGADCSDVGARPAAHWFDGIFGTTRSNFATGAPGLEWHTGGTGDENSYRVKAFRIYQFNPGTSGFVFTDGYASINLRADENDYHGYQVIFEGIRLSAADGFHIDTQLWEYGPKAGPDPFGIQLRSSFHVQNNIPLLQDTEYQVEASIEDDSASGHPTLYARVNGVVVQQFDLINDLADQTGTALPSDGIHTGGRVGLGGWDNGTSASRNAVVKRFEVLCPGGTEFPCEGPPDNPWPWNPPPPTTTPVFSLWVRKNNAWQFVPVDQLHPRFRGAYRNVDTLAPPQVYYRGAWRNIIGQNEMAPPDEPPGEPPPFFDPCEILPPIPPGDVTPIPISGRFIGSQAWPVTQMGPVANGSKRSQGSVSASLVELGQAAARSSVIMGAQGNYRQYLLNGRWNRDYFIDLTVSHLSPMLSQLVTYTGSGTYFGYSAIDDFDSHSLWPPSGVPDADMAYVFSALHSALPGIRLGMRGRPSQFSFDPGADFYEAQYKSWMGLTASQFATLEYNGARSRGALVCLNLNYLHGGNGSSGLRWNDGSGLGQSSHNFICSPTEVVDYLSDMFDTARNIDGAKFLAGSVGYMYDPFWIAIPGMLNAITIARNVMAQLPPP